MAAKEPRPAPDLRQVDSAMEPGAGSGGAGSDNPQRRGSGGLFWKKNQVPGTAGPHRVVAGAKFRQFRPDQSVCVLDGAVIQ